jgi:hypothetical protein
VGDVLETNRKGECYIQYRYRESKLSKKTKERDRERKRAREREWGERRKYKWRN